MNDCQFPIADCRFSECLRLFLKSAIARGAKFDGVSLRRSALFIVVECSKGSALL
jgi:hypothetical protein